MEPVKFSLCPACQACPAVEVRLGRGYDRRGREYGSAVAPEWNELVRLIKRGEIDEI